MNETITAVATVDEILDAIDSERDYQDSLWPANAEDRQHTVGEEILILEEYINAPEGIHTLRKAAAIACRCLENEAYSDGAVDLRGSIIQRALTEHQMGEGWNVTLPCFIRDLKALADAARVAWVRVAGDEIIACSVLYQVLAMAIYGMLFCGAVSRS